MFIVRWINKLHKDQRGSSMMIALVAIAFIGILAAVVTTTTMTNYKLRAMNATSKRTFYSAESAVEEIYSGLGERCYTELKEAYVKTVTSLVDIDNNKANKNLQKFYLYNINQLCNWGNEDEICDFLNTFITDTTNAHVKSVTPVKNADTTRLPFVVTNVVVEYRNKETDNFATVAFDMNVTYPDVHFDFIDDGNHLKSYVNYCLIGMEGIDIGKDAVSTVNIQGGALAGQGYKQVLGNGTGLIIHSGSTLNVKPGTDRTVNTYKTPTNIVVDGDITVEGTMNVEDSSADEYANTRIWAENIIVGNKDMSKVGNAGVLNYEKTDKWGTTETYFQDDLNVLGDGSKVTLAGMFMGNGVSIDKSKNSSAIVVNGTNATIKASDVSYLVLGGTAFVSLDPKANNSVEYKTSDSIGIKGLQTLYLVPTAYMKDVNPVPYNSAAGEKVDLKEFKNFFAYDLLNIDATHSGYVVKTDGKANYYYLDFKPDVLVPQTSRDSAYTEYIYRILNLKSSDGKMDYSDDEECIRLHNILTQNFGKYIKELDVKKPAPSDLNQVDSYGNLYSFINDTINCFIIDEYKTWDYDLVDANGNRVGNAFLGHNRTWNRYLTQKLYLYDTEDTDDAEADGEKTLSSRHLDSGDSIVVTNNSLNKVGDVSTTDFYIIDTTSNLYDFIIDTDSISSLKKSYIRGINADGTADGADYFSIAVNASSWGSDKLYLSDDKLKFTYSTVNNGKDVDTTAAFNGKGVILAYDMDVYVDRDFTGTVVTNKRIYVKNDCSITANAAVTDLVLSKTNISNMFYAYQEKTDALSPDKIKTTDLLRTYNWRKNYIDGDL